MMQPGQNNPLNHPQPPTPKLHHSFSLPIPAHSQQSNQGESSINTSSKIAQIFNIPDLKINKLYQKSIKEVMELMGQFDKFTDHMESKVDALLVAQQNEFVDSYKLHMRKVENQFKVLEQEVNRQRELIKYYQNQGKMSNLVKKVAMLQQQSKKLYEIIAKKDKQLKSSHLQIKVQKQQNKRLYTQMKQLVRARNKIIQKQSDDDHRHKQNTNKTLSHIKIDYDQNHNQNQEELNFFTTQIGEQKSIKKDLSITTDEGIDKKLRSLTYNLSDKSMISPEEEELKEMRLKKQLTNLTNKHRKLAKFNSKILQDRNQLQEIFINAVAQIKRMIQIKKKIKQCSYQDFTKQDKINLLLIIISNEQILKYVYERIFGAKDGLVKQNSVAIKPEYIDKLAPVGSITKRNVKSVSRKIGLPYI